MLNYAIHHEQVHITRREEKSTPDFNYPRVVIESKKCHALPGLLKMFPCLLKNVSAKDRQSAIATSESCQNCL